MMKVYVDTSVYGGMFDHEFEKWSKLFFKEVDLGLKSVYTSNLVKQEILEAPAEVKNLFLKYEKKAEFIEINNMVARLAETYISEKVLTPKFFNDAVHIAAATIYKVDVIVSWNFKHIVNLNRIRLFNSVNLKQGFSIIEIRSPREVLTLSA